ncbi:Flp family type IVb pilin [Candidatus Viridilinea mediisalina]|uniref:Flp family type IVb pilin n=1 Tax=Candidatus Viridilinea mediisalina TaxID=2024553 RepID=A0A2A6RPT4_9CHLR|nr:hypothetical protein [Candidatus Viridilinea mediisalina]PDW04943.1 hypothetical protein CJ255_00765 [Candidatus Viridilinea mediisalina]
MRWYASQAWERAIDMVRWLMAWLLAARARAPAQGLTEYGLVLVLIAITAVGILTLVGRTLSEVWYEGLVDALP